MEAFFAFLQLALTLNYSYNQSNRRAVMTTHTRHIFFFILISLILWFLYLERAILAPFILAGIFAYIFNPLVSFFTLRLKTHRGISVALVYLLIMIILFFTGISIAHQIISESDDLAKYSRHLFSQTKQEFSTLPTGLQQTLYDTLYNLQHTNYITSKTVITYFPQAFSRLISFVVFLFASFYLLKDGGDLVQRLIKQAPEEYQNDIAILLKKINTVLGGYLRGEIFLVAFVTSILFVALSILGIRFALMIAIFSGLAEIVPIIGPITAGAVAIIVTLITNSTHFGLSSVQIAILVTIVYFILRHIQDYFVSPYIMGKVTRLHPLIILLAVLSAQHLAGILGVLLAVPTAATIRILLTYFSEKIVETPRSKS